MLEEVEDEDVDAFEKLLKVDDIDPDEPLFVEGLGLDSIDALELGLALQKRYGITLESEAESSRQHFANLRSLAALVESRRQK